MKKLFRSLIVTIILAGASLVMTGLISPSTAAQITDSFRYQVLSIFDLANGTTPPDIGESAYTSLSSFHFLDPIAPRSGDASKFDGSLLGALTVQVCQVNGSDCTLVKSFSSQGSTSEQLRVLTTNKDGSYYIANWDTSRTDLNNKIYRVTVILARLKLGSIDLAPNVYLKFGRTWPIKFLIEKDPVLRVRHLHSLGRSASQITSVLKNEFGLSAEQIAELLANDLDPFSRSDIEIAKEGVFQDVVIPYTTKVSDEDTRNSLLSFDRASGEMTFLTGTPLLDKLNIGDVMVSEPSPAAPYGYLRKVTAIKKNKTQIILETVQAKLNEAVSQGTLKAAGELLPANASSLASSSGSAFAASGPGVNSLDVGDNFNFHRDIDVTIDLAGQTDGVQGTGTVRVQGFIDFNAGYDVGMGIETCAEIPPVCVDRVEAHVGVDQKSNIRVTGQFDGTLHKEQTIDVIQFDPIVFFIGPIPVVIVPTIDVNVGVDGEAHANFVFAAEASSVLTLGAKWTDPGDGGQGWQDINQFSPLQGRVIDASLNANLKVEGYAKANAKLLLYDVAGPGVGGRIGLGAEVRLGQKPLWTIYGHLVGDVNFSVDIADVIDLGNYSHKVLDESFKIGEAANQPPVFSNVNTGMIPAQVSVPIVLGPRAGFTGFFDCIDPEGQTLTYSASSNIDGPLSSLTPTFQTSGLRTITITARDPDNDTASITLTVDVRNSLPIVTINAAANTVPATTQYFVTATAYDPESGAIDPANGFLTCDHIQWTVTGGTSSPSGGGACGVVIVFTQVGQQTVTAKATDPNGGVGTASITVNVTPEPVNHPPVIGTFVVWAYRGPTDVCPDPNFYCLAPNNAILYNGQVGDYFPPLLLQVDASDPDGDPITVTWHCVTGSQEAAIGFNQTYQLPSCDPIYSSIDPIKVFAVVSDGTNQVNSPVRTYTMLQRVN